MQGAWRALVQLFSDNLIISAIIGLCNAADITIVYLAFSRPLPVLGQIAELLANFGRVWAIA